MNLTLFQLNNLVREVLELSMNDSYWVEAELADCHESRGHCYMELIEKDDFSNTPIARARACCWQSTWSRIGPRFERVTGQRLHAGMKVLLKVKAQFHEAFGFSWIVTDIDPNYTMGDMFRRREEIIQALKAKGVYDLNKSLDIPMFAQRIAVISSATAAGYGDFCNQLVNNEYGFQFTTRLFSATMQGEQVEESVIAALDSIMEVADDFDVVVIIRGGGATADMSGFDTLNLAENVANFPLPIITGIGHDRDECVLDMISCVRVKTPTAAADFLVSNLAMVLERITNASRRITELVRHRMEREKQRLNHIQSFLPMAFKLKKAREVSRMEHFSTRMATTITQRLNIEKHKLETIEGRIPNILKGRIEHATYQLCMLEQRTNALDPIHILRRGYGIVLHNGKAVKGPEDVSRGDEISILLAHGVVEAKVD